MLMAKVRSVGSRNMLVSSDSVEGASVAPAMPRMARVTISISALLENAARMEASAKGGSPNEQQLAPPDAVAQRAHRHQESRHHETIDVDDPQKLRRRWLQVGSHLRNCQVEHRQVHRIEHAGQRYNAKPDPFAPCRLGFSS